MELRFFERAISLAERGTGRTSPNPLCGAVIVRGGKILAEGFHERAGEDHAEIVAIKNFLKKYGNNFKDAELYVTLEPCCHVGKTGACTEAILKYGFKKVYVGMKDPFSSVNGKGIQILRKNGVKVSLLPEKSPLYRRIRQINQPFLKWAKTGLPYVILKAGISLDGKIATSTGKSQWITSESSRRHARVIRSLCDGVMVGAGTVMADDPGLLPDKGFAGKKLIRVIVDSDLRVPLTKKIFRDKNVIVLSTNAAPLSSRKKFAKAGINVFFQKKFSVRASLKFLTKMGISSVFVEGGSSVFGTMYDSFLKDRELIDRVLFYISPKLFGGEKSLPVIGGAGVRDLNSTPSFLNSEITKFSGDFVFSGYYNFY